MSKDLKKYELRACPRPLKTGRYKLLNNTVSASDATGTFCYAYVAFSDALVEKVGSLLSGVMEHDPAVLFVSLVDGSFYVYAWKSNKDRKLVFTGEGHPDWLKLHKVKKVQNGNAQKDTPGTKGRSPRPRGASRG